jgi:hypothetical protein
MNRRGFLQRIAAVAWTVFAGKAVAKAASPSPATKGYSAGIPGICTFRLPVTRHLPYQTHYVEVNGTIESIREGHELRLSSGAWYAIPKEWNWYTVGADRMVP